MWCVWAVKGGVGASVVSAALAVLAARRGPTLLVDLGCDQPAVLGLPDGESEADDDDLELGITDWLAAASPPPDALARLEVPVSPTLSLLPTGRLIGTGHPDGAGPPGDGHRARRLDLLGRSLLADGRPVIVDVGASVHRYEPILVRSTSSILVTRRCFLAMRRPLPSRPADHVVLVDEPGRALRRADVEPVLPAPIAATVDYDPIVARAVDAGRLGSRLPRPLRSLAPLAAELARGAGMASDARSVGRGAGGRRAAASAR